ncbi:hypothetical protein ACOALA_04005 [Alicyclobacillus acidoterrestris]|uniref:hypothetical protein n=1 Tax=Alicyclobacillus acidoterrestris TaxID=1450 RepID=UPI003F52ED85
MIQTDAESVYNERKLAEIRDRHDEWRANHYYLDIGFLLAQLDKANQTIAQKDAEIERLRKIEDAAWNAIETVPFGAHDVYQADVRAMGNLSAALEQNRGDKA